jgi:hypothetical protein
MMSIAALNLEDPYLRPQMYMKTIEVTVVYVLKARPRDERFYIYLSSPNG